MTRYINYKDTLFERTNLTPICGEPTFETLHKILDKIKANVKSVYSNIGGGAHVHLGLVHTNGQYALISPTPFVYPTHPGPFIILGSTTVQANYNTRIVYAKRVHLFR